MEVQKNYGEVVQFWYNLSRLLGVRFIAQSFAYVAMIFLCSFIVSLVSPSAGDLILFCVLFVRHLKIILFCLMQFSAHASRNSKTTGRASKIIPYACSMLIFEFWCIATAINLSTCVAVILYFVF